MAHKVTAPMIVVHVEGQQRYLSRGATLPDGIKKEHLKGLEAAGQIETVRRRSSADSTASETGTGGQDPSPPAKFDPSAHDVEEVTKYLATASEDEVARVKASESDGKSRKGVLEWERDPADSEND